MNMELIGMFQAYILYMRFARRAEGIKSARQVFKMAREDSRSKWQVFVSASLMEYYCSKVCVCVLFLPVMQDQKNYFTIH